MSAKNTHSLALIEDILTRGVEEVVDGKQLQELLASGKKLRIKLGIDPTSPSIHLGRAVVLWKLRAFQELGHTVVFIVGDFTGIIGDTSDKDSERPMLSEEEIKINLKTYFSQASKIIDKSKSEMHYNSKWLKKLGFAEIGFMANAFGLHEFEARENISLRMKAGKRVSLKELLYPLMQGYDSVAVKSDVELGGTDQRFNLLAGRTIQKLYNQKPQHILTTQLLEGTDGRKMSSSWGNVINITDEPENMFGKVMSVPDNFVEKYFLFATRASQLEIQEIFKSGHGPRELKLLLAERVTSLYHGEKKAIEAKESFISQFSKGELPKDIAVKNLPKGVYLLVDVLVLTGLSASKSEARRLIGQNGVKVNRQIPNLNTLTLDGKTEFIIQVGKRNFLKIK